MKRPVHYRSGSLWPPMAVLVLALGTTHAPPTFAADTDDMAFGDAMVSYERNHWREAYDALSALADRGHPEAARIALQMWRYGPTLYGSGFGAAPMQRQRWVHAAACTSCLMAARHVP